MCIVILITLPYLLRREEAKEDCLSSLRMSLSEEGVAREIDIDSDLLESLTYLCIAVIYPQVFPYRMPRDLRDPRFVRHL